MDALATADGEFLNGIADQLANASAHGQNTDERGLNFMLSVIKGIEPRDQLEAMLAAQIATPPPTLPDTNVVPMPSMGKSKEHDPLAVRRKSNK